MLAFVTRVLEYFGDPNWVIADFTVVLAFSTIGLWIVTWRSGVRQSRDMEGAIAAALAASEISLKYDHRPARVGSRRRSKNRKRSNSF
jgi:hypothetical protein